MKELIRKINIFVAKRNWHQFHNPKNLSMALASESGELLDIFQWLNCEDSKLENINQETLNLAKEEIADIFIYLLRLSEELKLDLIDCANKKIEKNEIKYPVNLAKDNSIKYSRRK